jgi:ferredoxin
MGITVDHQKCNATICNKCLKLCPKRVLGRFPVNRRKNVLSTEFRIEPFFPEFCLSDQGCLECKRVCPKNAIEINPTSRTSNVLLDYIPSILKKISEKGYSKKL